MTRTYSQIAHDFNNVLMSIQPFAEVIKRRAGEDEKLANAAEHILKAVAAGRKLTAEISQMGKV